MRAVRVLALCSLLAAVGAQADPVALQTMEMGQGPAIVFVHGLGRGRADWLPTVKRLRDHYRCVLVDLPGHGSTPMADPFTLQAAADALDGVIVKQSAESTIVVGQGVGGLLTLLAAASHPGHEAGVVLVDAQIKSPIPVSDQQREQLLKFIDENYAAFTQMAFSKMGRDSAESAQLFAGMAALPPATLKAYFTELLSAEGNKSLKALQCPDQLVITERLWKAGQTWGAVAHSLGIEDTTTAPAHRVAGAGMLVMRDQPDTLAAIVSGFSARCVAAKKK